MNDEHRNESSDTPPSRTSRIRPEGSSVPAEDVRSTRPGPSRTGSLVRDVALYSLARLALVVGLALVILYVPRVFGVEIPLLVAALFAVLIALPLSLVAFKSLRRRVNEGIAAVDERRRADRADLESRLRGEDRR